MPAIPEAFTAKLGPLPAWVWGIGLGGASLLYLRLRHPAVEPEPVDTPAADVTPGLDDGDPLAMSPSPLGGGGTWVIAPPTGTGTVGNNNPSGRPVFANNREWRNAATDWLISRGFDAIGAQTALQKALDGSTLTAAEAAMVRSVLRDFAIAPEGMPAIRVQRPPAPRPNPRPPAPAPPGQPPAPPPGGWYGNRPPAAPNNGQTPGTVPTGPAGAPVGLGRRTLTVGMSGDDVRSLQRWLNDNTAPRPPLAVDGLYGPKTAGQVDNLFRFLGNGVRNPDFGPPGTLNAAGWGLLDYISESRHVRRP